MKEEKALEITLSRPWWRISGHLSEQKGCLKRKTKTCVVHESSSIFSDYKCFSLFMTRSPFYGYVRGGRAVTTHQLGTPGIVVVSE